MKEKQIYIFSKSFPPRLRYVNYLVFELILGLGVIESQDLEAFEALHAPKINYSPLKIANSFHIQPISLLFEKNIHAISPKYKVINNTSYLFPTQNGDLPFDVLAAAFYIVSRYEEYLATERDQHDRFPAHASILSELGCLTTPIVQVWVKKLQEALTDKFASLRFKKLKFDYVPSFDIDMAWSYKGKGWYRTIGAIAKDLLSFDISSNRKRLQVLSGAQRDPFDTIDYLKEQTTNNGLKPIFFFLMGKFSNYDKNINPSHPKFAELIHKIAHQYLVGIHPSYYSAQNLDTEIASLEKATQQKTKTSRQHFIKLKLPETYRHLINNGIEKDYSMGYPDKLGFRNGLAIPSLWYDLQKEEITNLQIHPFQIMDVTLKNYLKLSPGKAIEEIKTIVNTIHEFGGTMISIWHNSSFDKDWEGWQIVFEEMLSYTSEHSTKSH